MNEQFWSKVTEGIDERFTNEAAEHFAKYAPTELADSDFTKYSAPAEDKRRRGGLWLGIGAAAAAIVLCIAGGAFFLRGDVLLPADTPTEEATFESGESTEQADCIMISDFAERPLSENGRVEGSYFEEPVPAAIPLDVDAMPYLTDEQKSALDGTEISPIFTLRGEDEWYFIYAHDTMTTSCTRYEVKRYVDGDYMISVGDFSMDGEQLTFNTEPVLTEDYIIWYLFTEDEGFFIAMDIRAFGMDNTFVLEFEPRALNAPANDPVVTGTNEITYVDDNGNMTRLTLDHDNSGELSVRDIVTDTVIITDFATGDCHAIDVDGKAVIRVKGELGGLDRIETGCEVDHFHLIDYDGDRVVWYMDNSDGTDTVFCQDIASSMRYKYKLSGRKGYMAELLEGMLYLYDDEHILADLDSHICYKSLLDEVEETAETADTDEWKSMKHYTGAEPDVLAFIDEISAGALEYQEQVQRNALENAEDDSYREAAQQAIDEGGLDIYCESATYVQTDNGGEFWVKFYRIMMAQNAQYFEFYHRDENGFTLLHTYNGGMIISAVCDGEALYYSCVDGFVEMIQPDGSRKELLSVSEEAPPDAKHVEELEVLELSMSGYEQRLTAAVSYGYYSAKAEDWIFRDDTYLLEGGEILSSSSTGYGYEIRNGEAIPYPYIGGAHDHLDISNRHKDLLTLGQMRFNEAVKLYQIMHRLPEGDENDRLDGALIALYDKYFVSKTGYHDSIASLYDCTFAQDVYAYEDVYFAVRAPDETPWLTSDNRGDITLKEHIENRLHYQDGKVYAVDDCSLESNAAWTNIVGLLDYEEGVYADYLLCTACFDGNGDLVFEHSVMTLTCIEGEWLITQLRWHLGNEYGESRKQQLIDMGYDYLMDAPMTAVEIIERDLIEPQGYTLLSYTEHDLDFDGEGELLLLAGNGEERSIFVFDFVYNDWHFSEQLTDERFNGMDTFDAHYYLEGDRECWFFVNGEPENASLVMVEFVQEGEPNGGDINGGSYVIGDAPHGTDGEYEHKCCLYALNIPGMSGNSYYEDFDHDGIKEKMVHIGYGFYFFEEIHGYWIQQQVIGDEWLEKAELMPSDWGYHGTQMELGMDYSDYDGGCWLYEYWGGNDNCVAQITAAIKHNDSDGYYIEYVCSYGSYIEPVDGQPDFYRYGWDDGTDFERITNYEFWEFHSELFGYDDDSITTPIELRISSGLKHVGEDDVSRIAREQAAIVLSGLAGYGDRTFSIFQYKDISVELIPVSEAGSEWNVTDEERALENAWIADISAMVRYTGTMGGEGAFGWVDIAELDNNIGWLLREHDGTYSITSRYYNENAV